MDTLLKDLRHAARGLLRAPGVAAVAVVALGLGIGLTTVMFSIVYGALYRGLPFEDGERIMTVNRLNPARGPFPIGVPIHDFRDWQEHQRSFEKLAAFYGGTVSVRAAESADRYQGAFMTANALDVVGVQPILGRGFAPEDERPGAPIALLLGYAAWRDRFGSERDVVGRDVTVNGEPGVVIGVLPEGFLFPVVAEAWIPIRLDPLEIPRGRGQTLTVFGKLREEVSLAQAQAEFEGLAAALAAEHPDTNDGVVTQVRPYTDNFMDGEARTTLLAMLATVGLVLLIACANVANLLLARAAVRTRDVAIRVALGATRRRVVLQLLAESLVLAVGGAALGTGLAWVGIGLFDRAVAPTNPPFWFSFRLDAPILAFVAGASALAALLSGMIPALRASSADLGAVLKDESRGSSGLHIGRLSRALVVAEVAMSVAILVAAGLMIRTTVRLDRMTLPFPTTDVFTARLGVFESRFPDAEARLRFWEDVEERLASIPGARESALVTQLPGIPSGNPRFALDGESYSRDEDLPQARTATVSPGFFGVFDVSPLQGRVFTRLDGADAPPVALVNQSFVREHFPDGQALGRRIRVGDLASETQWREIVGVVADLALEGVANPEEGSAAGFYLPLAQNDQRFLSLAVRTDGGALTITPRVREQVAAADPDTPIYWEGSLQDRIDEGLWFYRVFGTLFSVFGVAALFMASVGLYGVMSFSVSRRALEMGIRMALGADAGRVRRLIVRQGMLQIALGLAVGAGLAVLVARGLQIFFLGTRPWDPTTYALVFAVLALTGFAASAVPAARATRVDPSDALRRD